MRALWTNRSVSSDLLFNGISWVIRTVYDSDGHRVVLVGVLGRNGNDRGGCGAVGGGGGGVGGRRGPVGGRGGPVGGLGACGSVWVWAAHFFEAEDGGRENVVGGGDLERQVKIAARAGL